MKYYLIIAAVLLIPYSFLPHSVCGALLSIIGCIFLFKEKSQLKVNKYILFSILALNILSIISFTISKNINLFFDGFFIYLPLFIFYLLFTKLETNKLLNAFVYISSISVIIFVIIQGLILNDRVDGTISYANTYGLLLLIALYLNEIIEKSKFYSPVQWVLILGIFFTESRNTLIYLIIFVILCCFIEVKNKKEPTIIINFLTTIVLYTLTKYIGLGTIFVMPIFYIIFYYIYDKVSMKIKKYISLLSVIIMAGSSLSLFFMKTNLNIRLSDLSLTAGTLQERLIYYEDVIKAILNNPLGSGINSFVYNQCKIQSAFYDVKYVHNSFLQISYDLGIIGLLFFTFIFLYGLYLIIKFEDKSFKVIKIALILTIYLHSLLDFDFSYPSIFITVIMLIDYTCKVKDFNVRKPLTVIVIVLSSLVSLYVLLINSFTLLGDAFVKNDINKAVFLYQLNKNITLKNPDIYVYIAQWYKENNKLEECINNLKFAEQINNDDPRIKMNLAFTYEKMGDVENTIKYYDTTLDYEKYYSEIYKRYYLFLNKEYKNTSDDKYKSKMDNLRELYYKNYKSLNKKAIFLKDQMSDNFDIIIGEYNYSETNDSGGKAGIFADYYKEAKEKLAALTLEEKVGQLFLIRCPDLDSIKTIKELSPGGFILFENDFKDKTSKEVTETILQYQNSSKTPMIIGVDEEGGTVVRVSGNSQLTDEKFKSPQELFKDGGMDAIYKDASKKSSLLKKLGINLNLAPVADVSTNENDYIYPRSFGKSANETAEYVKTVVKAMKENQLSAALKHFPGYGNNSDTHTEIAYDKRAYNSFVNSDFIPFKAGIEAGAESVLVSHNIVECMDDELPASLSPKVHQVLRKELSFKGVIITDDLAMDAVSQYLDDIDTSVMAIKAGNDLIINSDFKNGYNSVLKAVKDGEIPEKRIDDSVLRILEWKYYMKIMK